MSSIERTVRSGSAPLQSIKESYQKDLKGGNVIMAVTMALVPHDALSEIYNSEVEIRTLREETEEDVKEEEELKQSKQFASTMENMKTTSVLSIMEVGYTHLSFPVSHLRDSSFSVHSHSFSFAPHGQHQGHCGNEVPNQSDSYEIRSLCDIEWQRENEKEKVGFYF
ncbi:hypothetical protein LSM04_003897 [Trypanosoma melophagium]|uniref:uncharacterized protein n=1 Tax=Trypanosoma melophagium TaxID=715481 RepID=UPI00351A7F11|nr:hypothetical protein LSM04_003897 [Trypanosoma melophagium]